MDTVFENGTRHKQFLCQYEKNLTWSLAGVGPRRSLSGVG